MTKRLNKKYYKRVVTDQQQKQATPKFYLSKAIKLMHAWYERRYLTIIGPEWWEGFEQIPTTDFKTYMKQAYSDADVVFKEESFGLHPQRLAEDYKKVKRKQVRKPRKIKETVIRKLRKPETFLITNKHYEKIEVTGEVVFTKRNYKFFIHRTEDPWGWRWTVSDATCGMRVASSDRYKQAVKQAEEIIDKNFERYLNTVNLREEEQS
jgi:hypothetical protein